MYKKYVRGNTSIIVNQLYHLSFKMDTISMEEIIKETIPYFPLSIIYKILFSVCVIPSLKYYKHLNDKLTKLMILMILLYIQERAKMCDNFYVNPVKFLHRLNRARYNLFCTCIRYPESDVHLFVYLMIKLCSNYLIIDNII